MLGQRPPAFCLVVFAIGSGYLARRHAAEPVGLVIDTDGKWTCTDESKKAKPLVAGDRVPGGAAIRPADPTNRNASITIVNYEGKAEIFRSSKTFAPRPASTVGSRLWNAIVGTERTSWASAIARGERLDDGIAKLDDGQVDLSSIFCDWEDGTYVVRLRPLLHGKAQEAVDTDQEFAWKHETPEPLRTTKIKAGLYELEIADGDDQQTTGPSAWVLIVPRDRFDRVAQDYREVVEATDAWPAEVKPLSIIGYRRAFLESLVPSDAGRGQ